MASLEHDESVVTTQEAASTYDDAETRSDKKPIWIYIDNSNIWRSAKQLAAKKAWFKTEEDPRIRISMEKLTDIITQSRPVAGGVVFGLKQAPVDVNTWPNWEAKMQSAADVNESIYRKANETPPKELSTIVVVSGDSCFHLGIKRALERGWNIEIYSWSHALAKCLKDLANETDNLLVKNLDECIDEVTFIRWKFDPNSSFSNTKVALRHSFSDQLEFCEMLEKISRWPFQFYEKKPDHLILVFPNDPSGECFDVDVFLGQLTKYPGNEGVKNVEYYEKEGTEYPRCPGKMCCHFGTNCNNWHTDEEKEFFKSNGGVGKPYKKVKPCTYFECYKPKGMCGYAHGEEDALCCSCGMNGHFEDNCPRILAPRQNTRGADSVEGEPKENESHKRTETEGNSSQDRPRYYSWQVHIKRNFYTAARVLVDAASNVLREVCETEKKVTGLPLPNRSADTIDEDCKQLVELDVTALANHLLDSKRLTYKHDCGSFFEKLFEAKTEFKKLEPGSTDNEYFLVIVPSGKAQASPPLAEEDKVFIYLESNKYFKTNVLRIIRGTNFVLNYRQRTDASVDVYRPTDAWRAVHCLKRMRNDFSHLKSTDIASDTYHLKVLQSTRDAVEKLKDSKLITETFAYYVCRHLDEIERDHEKMKDAEALEKFNKNVDRIYRLQGNQMPR